MKQKNGISLFIQILIVFMVVILLVYLLVIYIFQSNSKAAIKQSIEAAQKQVEAYFSNLETDLQRIERMQTDFLLDSDLNELKYTDFDRFDYDVSKKITRVIDNLTTMSNSSNIISCCSAYMASLNMKLNASGSRSSYEIIEDEKESGKFSANNTNGLIWENNELFIRSTPLYWQGEGDNMPLVLETVLSSVGILKNINQYKITENAESYIMFYDRQYILSSQTPEHIAFVADNYIFKEDLNEVNDKNYVVLTCESPMLNARYLQLIPRKEILGNVNSFNKLSIMFTVLVIITVGIFVLVIYILIKKPMDILLNAFLQVEKEHFEIQINHKANDDFAVVYNSFNTMVNKINVLISKVYLQKILNQKSELRQLQSQINPHFLYNSFFTLKNRIAQGQYGNAEEFCEMIGKYFLYITKNYKDYSTLGEEAAHAKLYSDIQAIRFVNSVEIEFDEMPPEFNDVVVPKMILQPIIENAFKYGLEAKEFEGLLRVTFEKEGEFILINVEDNGDNLPSDKDSLSQLQKMFDEHEQITEPTGLLNIHKRIRLFSDESSGLILSHSELGGLKVTLKLLVKGEGIDDNNLNCR